MCDEVSDRSKCELMSLVIRFVGDDGEIHECLVALIEVSSTAAENLSDVIVKKLNELHLSLDSVVGQCFDGASNMSGIHSGVQAHIKELCSSKPIFIHCWAHVLNLIVQDIVRLVPSCSMVFDTLQKLYVFIEGSPKRHGEYMSLLSELDLGNDGPCVLQSLSATRWSSRCVNLRIVHRCLPAISAFLETQSSSDARGLLAAKKRCPVLVCYRILERTVC